MDSKPGINIKASVCLASAVTLWSTIPLFLRSFIHEIDAWTANGTRYPFAALLWLGPLLWMARRGQVTRRVCLLALGPSIANVFAQSLWAWAPYHLEPAMMMFLARISIVFTVAGSLLAFGDERPLARRAPFWLGLALCAAGFIGMNLPGNGASVTWTGLAIITIQAFFMAGYVMSVRYFMRGVRPWIAFPVICAYTSAALFVLMFLLGEPSRLLDMGADRLAVLALSSFVGIALAHVVYYYAIEHIGVAISSGVGLLSPFLTAAGSYWIFGERLSWTQWLFGVLLLCGAGLLMREQQSVAAPAGPSAGSQIPELEEFSSAGPEPRGGGRGGG